MPDRRLLVCPPDHYHIAYEINPWMQRQRDVDTGRAREQWDALEQALTAAGAVLERIQPQRGWPDMVFTANAGLVSGRQVIASRFRHPERQGETEYFRTWFAAHGYDVINPPATFDFEGEGDALFCGETLFCGYRFRSDIGSHRWIGDRLRCLAISLELIDPRFYHLDTCFCPLGAGRAAWYPPAFDRYAQQAVRGHVPDLVEVEPDEALRFACNAVVLGRQVILPAGCPVLSARLAARGYRCQAIPMTEFLKAGGACKCLVLHL